MSMFQRNDGPEERRILLTKKSVSTQEQMAFVQLQAGLGRAFQVSQNIAVTHSARRVSIGDAGCGWAQSEVWMDFTILMAAT